jgi:hypothetical protein
MEGVCRLPTELLLHTIHSLIPSNPPIAFPASHIVTRTLLKLCLVSKTIHYAAIRLLFAHCVYIDSPDRLRLLLQTLVDHHLERAFGSRIPRQLPLDRDYPDFNLETRHENTPKSFINSLFLAPFPDDTIDSPEIAPLVLGLCTTIGHYLTRLVIDIPLRSLRPEDDTNNARPFLRAAFQQLVALEEFVSARDELYLDVAEHDRQHPDMWSTWPNLKRLALYNVDVSPMGFLRDIQQCRQLTHLVLTRADGLTESVFPSSPPLFPPPPLQMSHSLQRVLIVNFTDDHKYRPAFSRRRWENCFLGKVWTAASDNQKHKLQITRIDVPLPGCREADYEIELCQEWVCEAAIQGTLWELPGAPLLVEGNPKEVGGLQIGWRLPGSHLPDLSPNMCSDSE